MSNQSSKSPEYTLGTLEFCAALNGDDPELVRVVLQKFIRLVRKERRQALLVDESSSIQDEEEEDTRDNGEEDVKYYDDHTHLQQPPTKKPKLESWKLDSKAYNVPFVGSFCSSSSQCIARCCSSKYADDGKLKCTPLSTGFKSIQKGSEGTVVKN